VSASPDIFISYGRDDQATARRFEARRLFPDAKVAKANQIAVRSARHAPRATSSHAIHIDSLGSDELGGDRASLSGEKIMRILFVARLLAGLAVAAAPVVHADTIDFTCTFANIGTVDLQFTTDSATNAFGGDDVLNISGSVGTYGAVDQLVTAGFVAPEWRQYLSVGRQPEL
jgi:hypothetical protein